MLRVLTYNIRRGGGDRLPAITEILRAQQPDAIALVEAPEQARVDALARTLAMRAAFCDHKPGFPIAWLSRLPIQRAETHQYLQGANPMLEIEIAWNGLAVALFAVHLRSGRAAKKERHRAREVAAILGRLPRVTGQPHLLVGDFNALRPMDHTGPHRLMGLLPSLSRAERAQRLAVPLLLDAGYADCYRAQHRGMLRDPGYTFALPNPRLRVDYVFASAQLARRLVACEVVTGSPAERASDHYPVVAEFV
jgi:exodeoxyribonuclease-3